MGRLGGHLECGAHEGVDLLGGVDTLGHGGSEPLGRARELVLDDGGEQRGSGVEVLVDAGAGQTSRGTDRRQAHRVHPARREDVGGGGQEGGPASAVVLGWWALAAVALGVSLIIMDGTVVNVALPVVIGDLHLSSTDAEWMNASYALMFAALLLTVGRLGDLHGRRLLFLVGCVLGIAGCAIALGAYALGLYPTTSAEANVSAARAQAL